MKRFLCVTAAMLPLCLPLDPALAVPRAKEASATPSMKELQNALRRQEQLIRAQAEQLESQQRQLSELKSRIEGVSGTPFGEPRDGRASAAPRNTGQNREIAAATDAAQEPTEVGTDRKPIASEKIPEITVLDNHAGVLLKKGRLVVEPGIEYSNSSSTLVDIQGFTIIPALNIGAFQISNVNRDIVTARMTGRLGVTDRLEIDASVPYLYRQDRTRERPFGVGSSTETLETNDSNGLGDIEMGAHYQLNDSTGNAPVFIANARFKTITGKDPFEVDTDPVTGLQTELPTGSGFYAFEPSLTAIFPSDPVVFFGNLGYVFNFSRDISGIGDIDPGDIIDASIGMSLALNDRTSLSFSYNHDLVFKTELNGDTLPGSSIAQIGVLNVGTSYKLYENTSLNFIAGAGVTRDAPDVSILFKVPISFDLY